MYCFGQYREKLKTFLVCLNVPSPLCIKKFPRKNFPPRKCEAKLVPVASEPVSKLLFHTFRRNIFSLQPVENMDGCQSGSKLQIQTTSSSYTLLRVQYNQYFPSFSYFS